MHIVYVSLSVPLIILGCAGLMLVTQKRHVSSLNWNARRELYTITLVGPILALGIGLSGLHDFLIKVCGLSEQVWYGGIVAILAGMSFIAVGGIGLSGLRLWLMHRVINRNLKPAPHSLQIRVDAIAAQLDVCPPKLLFKEDDDRPLALTWGVRQTTLLLSTWMVAQLEYDELEAVLAHELAHIKRRDFLVAWFSTLLRDAFFYLPASRTAHAQIKHDSELACDELAVATTGQPLALASALVKTWQHALGTAPMPDIAPALLGARTVGDIEMRIERLIAISDGELLPIALQPISMPVRVGLWVGLLTVFFVNLLFVFGPLGCGNLLMICQ